MSYDSEQPAYGGGAQALGRINKLAMDITPTKRQHLLEIKQQLELKMREVDDAIKALDENPGVEKVLDLLRKVGV